ncbi:chemotaxis protein CheW [Thermocoleostomius sinensis]|jgi:twitching motility protein PilI|uniref:Chemotaxis protein CheW n=1 Tax=Thermocoleostomius sinensis A174 TaxID=2016057 RepID=A0A9E8ZL23_9CYAN|nr:chemotaxis protein CheW [Thermocoleostomius sinensis]WAL60461.1 chemotaxis protein CheW [Thermocoleostomius sinensis A174]
MNSSALVPSSKNSSRRTSGDAYLRFELCPQTSAVLFMRYVQEAMILSARRLTPMPNMPPCMLGLMNRRSRVLWVVDLAQMLGLAILDTNAQQYSLVLIQVGAVSLGLAVQRVEGIAWIDPNQTQPPIGQVLPSLLPYLRGCAVQQQEHRQDILLMLDAEAIAQSPILRNP